MKYGIFSRPTVQASVMEVHVPLEEDPMDRHVLVEHSPPEGSDLWRDRQLPNIFPNGVFLIERGASELMV